MKCFVTGGSGFIGANLVHELNARGHEVRILLRTGSDLRGLEGADYERVEGDILDASCLEDFMRGCGWCFHLAANYNLWLRDYRPMYATNVQGTRNVLTAASRVGCSRIVYTSTVGCIGLPKPPANGECWPADEVTPIAESLMTSHYKRSKWQAELLALGLAKQGVPIIVVNPSAPVGPRDVRPTPTGKVVLDFLRHKMPAYLDTGLNWVHVRDVAIGHIAAAESGRIGERYILGNNQGNLTMKDTFHLLERISGVPAPRLKLPTCVALAAAHCNEALSFLTGNPPKAAVAGVQMARHKMFFNPAKAIRELNLPQTPIKQAFADAVLWFRENQYAT